MTLKVYQVAPAPAGTAAWVERLLAPVIEAARLDRAPPLEFRLTGRWRGWSAPRSMAPDGRVALSNLMLFRSRLELVDVYLHEVAHALLHDVPGATPGHDCAFVALNAALRMRVDSRRESGTDGDPDFVSQLSRISLYDMADLPPAELGQDVGRCMTWSLELAEEMATSDRSAESIAREVVRRHEAWLAGLRDQPRLDGISARQVRAQSAMVEGLRDRLFVSNVLAFVSTAMLVLIALMLFRR